MPTFAELYRMKAERDRADRAAVQAADAEAEARARGTYAEAPAPMVTMGELAASLGPGAFAHVAAMNGINGLPKVTTERELKHEAWELSTGQRPPLVGGQAPAPQPQRPGPKVREWLADGTTIP